MQIAVFEPIDVKGGDVTFGQRLELGMIFSQEKPEHEVFLEAIECAYGRRPDPNEYKNAIPAFKILLEGIQFWIDAEAKHLKCSPTAEEIEAGIEAYNRAVGEMGTVYALADKFKLDPDIILGWKYGKVFGILVKQHEDNKFQKRYNEIINRKHRR